MTEMTGMYSGLFIMVIMTEMTGMYSGLFIMVIMTAREMTGMYSGLFIMLMFIAVADRYHRYITIVLSVTAMPQSS